MDRALLEGPIGPAAVECRPVNDGVDWTARWISRRALQHRKGARRVRGQRTILNFDAAQRRQMSDGQAAVRASAAGQSLQRMRYQWRRLSTMCRSSRSTGASYSVSIVSCQLSLGHRQSSSEEDTPPSQPAPPRAWLLSQRSVSAKPWRGQRSNQAGHDWNSASKDARLGPGADGSRGGSWGRPLGGVWPTRIAAAFSISSAAWPSSVHCRARRAACQGIGQVHTRNLWGETHVRSAPRSTPRSRREAMVTSTSATRAMRHRPRCHCAPSL
jgi:hypothetical protein